MSQTGEEVVHKQGGDARYRMCFCTVCRTEQRCVPTNDFYGMNDTIARAFDLSDYDADGLICSGCYRKALAVLYPDADLSDPHI